MYRINKRKLKLINLYKIINYLKILILFLENFSEKYFLYIQKIFSLN